MDRNQLFGGNPLAVLLRLVVLSIIVGIVLSALGIHPSNLFYHFQILIRRISDMGFDAVHAAISYFLIGAVIVIPIWLVARLIGLGRSSTRKE